MKLTKIVCTIGPASESPQMLGKLIKAGMNVCRLNFSHGTHESHLRLIKRIRAAAKKMGQEVAILEDLQGPRIRIGEVPESGVAIDRGSSVALVPQEMYQEKNSPTMLPHHVPGLSRDVKPGHHILIADGTMDLRVTRVSGPEIHCTVVVGGVAKSHKGLNVPGASLRVPAITEKDIRDVTFGAENGVDYVALSFIKNAADVRKMRSILRKLSRKYTHAATIGIIAKIERPEAVEHADELLKVVDGFMIARGDLGIEVPAERVPLIQKDLIQKCLIARKPVIVATQMMESMIASRRPSRADVSDVANAVIDHTDAVMLSGESATGQYPFEVVSMMAQTVRETERSKYDDYVCERIRRERTEHEMIAHAAATLVLTRQVKCIVVKDDAAELVLTLSSHRPGVPIVAWSADVQKRRKLCLVRGVTVASSEKQLFVIVRQLKLARRGDRVLTLEHDELELTRMK